MVFHPFSFLSRQACFKEVTRSLVSWLISGYEGLALREATSAPACPSETKVSEANLSVLIVKPILEMEDVKLEYLQ
ncbi:hypothetical protein Tco_1047735, partial [Tanacetum coccineum]